MSEGSDVVAPRVFISYSWTSDEYVEWVVSLAERLMADGIDVVLDQWSLDHGHDLNAFMERMVTDPSIKRVIAISDKAYAEKANARKGGVGTESTIISQEVYKKVDQNKFIPVVREVDENGEAYLPIFFKSRKYIDMSTVDNEAVAYDELIRNIFDRPSRRKPALGKPPSHIFEEDSVFVSSAQKSKRFCDFVISGRGNASAAFDDFVNEFFENFEELRMTYSREINDEWCKLIMANIEKEKLYRDTLLDVIVTGAKHVRDSWFVESLLSLLERLMAYQLRPKFAGAHFRCSEDNYKYFIYESFLYTIATFVKAKRYEECRSIIDAQYVTPSEAFDQPIEGHSFISFNSYAESLGEMCATRGDHRRLSVMADLVHDRATRTDIRFSDLLQADVLSSIAARKIGSWYPHCIIYASEVRRLELFIRAVNERGLCPLRTILQISSAKELIQELNSQQLRPTLLSERLSLRVNLNELLNLREIAQAWKIGHFDELG